MTKISQYPTLSNPTEDDILIGTDVNSSDVTKNFSIGSIIDLIGDIDQGPIGPQGNTGPTGPQGPVGPAGLNWQGNWNKNNSYVEDDAVGFGGASYFCILDVGGGALNDNPENDTTHWALLASQGAVGPTGPAGPIGPQGPAGGVTYKVYTALLKRTGTTVQSPIVLENTLGTLTFSYDSQGIYNLTSANLFETDKTVVFVTNQPSVTFANVLNASRISKSTVQLVQSTDSGTNDNNWVFPVSIEIRVYD